MLERKGVHNKAVVPQCAFGLKDPVSDKPYQKLTSLDVTSAIMARGLCRGVRCCHGPGEHEQIQGSVQVGSKTVRRSTLAARWPRALCDRILDAAEEALKGQQVVVNFVGISEASEGECWETVSVSYSSFAEEKLRKHFQENALSGERYDYVGFDGAALQQPRRLRAMVAHLHVVMGHLPRERLARMLTMSGAQESIIQMARNLRCQVCAMVRPRQNTPKVADDKPKEFNERLSGDTFYIWDGDNKKYGVTHFIDGLTDYHIGDLCEVPDSGFARRILQDQWIAVFGPPDHFVCWGDAGAHPAVRCIS